MQYNFGHTHCETFIIILHICVKLRLPVEIRVKFILLYFKLCSMLPGCDAAIATMAVNKAVQMEFNCMYVQQVQVQDLHILL